MAERKWFQSDEGIRSEERGSHRREGKRTFLEQNREKAGL